MHNFKITSLEYPTSIWEHKSVKEVFTSIVNMKLNGYKSGFQGKHHVLPFDGTDFIGTHHLLSLKQDEQSIPLLAYKTCSISQCTKYNIPFGLLSSVKSSGSSVHQAAVEQYLAVNPQLNISYDSSFTINPIVNENPELALSVHQVLYALGKFHKEDYKIDATFMLANLAFKTDVTFRRMGATPFEFQSKELEPITCPYLGYSSMKIFLCENNYSQKTLNLSLKYRSLWDSRTVLSLKTLSKEILKKAS